MNAEETTTNTIIVHAVGQFSASSQRPHFNVEENTATWIHV